MLIFGGTTEGRRLARALSAMGHQVWVSVATPLGAEELAGLEDVRGIDCGVLGTVDGNAGHGDAGGHLHHRQQRVHAAQVTRLHGHADNRQRGKRSHDTAQVSSLAGGGDNHLDAAVGSSRGPLVDLRRRAVRARDHELIGHTQRLELGGATFHNAQIGLGAHDDPDNRLLICHKQRPPVESGDAANPRPLTTESSIAAPVPAVCVVLCGRGRLYLHSGCFAKSFR